ncbi:DUF4406 domain-containing protein [Clostridium magnum]|uniref:Nucleoside 2-deoxyribosyltransferase n=1 Tax=Clostridium magnum DSM 2767 TaxID=1121326 RepID=A0A162QLX5_9CLOT|nr:DUF4406 domain-containing protein [Clostridium magnum]KZL88693.1 hypothetical protein CLMAG_59820 [Clostridium magnum DSM 2767]SHJ64187.1 protein of unknown function [Clostridium magnum DSM 2767]
MDIAYVGGPYRAKTKLGIIRNIIVARKVAKKLWKLGYGVICPHSNSALFNNLPEESFINGDIEMLKRCDVLVLVPGWENSAGTLGEIETAIQNHIPIYELEGDNLIGLEINYAENVEG